MYKGAPSCVLVISQAGWHGPVRSLRQARWHGLSGRLDRQDGTACPAAYCVLFKDSGASFPGVHSSTVADNHHEWKR